MIGKRKGGRTSDYGFADSSAPDFRGVDPERRARSEQAPRRVKSLAGVAAASVAIALVSAAYGTWAALSAQATIEEARADTQMVLVASSEVKAGDVLEKSALNAQAVPRSLLVQGAYPPDMLEGDRTPVGKRALVDIPAGSQVTPAVIAGSTDGGYLAAVLQPGMQAVTIAVDAESGIAGQLRQSDRVRVVALDATTAGAPLLSTICDSVRVVALDAVISGGTGAYSSVTLEVSPEQADAVRAAGYAGEVSLTLLPLLGADGSVSEGYREQHAPVVVEDSNSEKEAPRG